MALVAAQLEPQGYRQLAVVLRAMRGGSIGFDLFRNAETRLKSGLIEFMLREHTEEQIRAAFEASGLTLGPPPQLPEGYVPPEGDPRGLPENGGREGRGGQQGQQQGQDGSQGQQDGQQGEGEGQGDGQQGEGKEQQGDAKDGQQGEQGQQQDEKQGAGGKPKPKSNPQQEHRHPIFEKVLALASVSDPKLGRLNVMLVGPAGCGKTHLFGQVMKALGREYASISGSAGASESQLIGRLLPTGEGGRFEYHASPFIQMYEGGGGFLFDEIDAFDPNMLIVTNQATANGSFIVEARSAAPRIVRSDKTILMGAANTFGVGAGAMYVGRNQLDAATLDRWYVVEMDYDTEYEASLASPEVLKWVWALRQKVQANRLRRVISTRMVQKLGLALKAGLPIKEARKDLLSGYTKDELQKLEVA